MNIWEQVGTGVESFEQVLIPALRRSYQNRCEVLFFLEGESHASQIFGLPFEKATPLYYIVHFPKALKRTRNNAGPASILLY